MPIHEISGCVPHHEGVAKDLAAAEYGAAAVGLFRGAKAGSLDEGTKLGRSVPNSELQGISAGGRAQRAKTGARKVDTTGFCMGGGFTLQAACDLGVGFCVDSQSDSGTC